MQKAAHLALLLASLTYLATTIAATALPFYAVSVEEERLIKLAQDCEVAKFQFERLALLDATRGQLSSRQTAVSAMNDCVELSFVEAHLHSVGVEESATASIKLRAIQDERVPIEQRIRFLELTQ